MKIIPMILICCFIGFLFFGGPLLAEEKYDVKTGLDVAAKDVFKPDTKVDETTPAKIIGKLLTYLLTLLELVFLVIVIVSGFVWMTAGGDSAKTEKALKWLINGVIGLVIATAAYFIISFVMKTAIETVEPTPIPEEAQP